MRKALALFVLLALGSVFAYSSEILDQAQTTITYAYWFDSTNIQWQEFTPRLGNITSVAIYINAVGTAGNAIVEIRTTGGISLAQTTIPEAELTGSGWHKVTLPWPVDCVPGEKMRIYVSTDAVSPGPSNRYFWRGNNSSPYNPSCETSVSGGNPDYDFAFKSYGLNCTNRNIGYVYSSDSTTANGFKAFLDAQGYPTTLILQSNIVPGIFDSYGLILVGNETGYHGAWGDAAKVSAVNDSKKPVLGLYEGGAGLFQQLGLAVNWLHGGYGPGTGINIYAPSHVIFKSPLEIQGPSPTLYSSTDYHLNFYNGNKTAEVLLLGQEPASTQYFTVTEERNRFLFWGYYQGPSAMTPEGQSLFKNIVAYMLGVKNYFVGTWDGQGVYYKNSYSGTWGKMGTPAGSVAMGCLSGEYYDDLLGVWGTGTWVKSTTTGLWSKLGNPAIDVASGDMNGDGRDDLVGAWVSQGTFYRNTLTGAWVRLASPATRIAVGDLDGDAIDDLLGVWADGTWVKYSKTGTWSRLATPADDVAAGDMNGDGRDDLVGTWAGQGVYYLDSAGSGWVKLASPATKVAVGDLDRDNVGDLVGVWADGTWVKYSSLGNWSKLGSSARDVAAGNLQGGAGIMAKDDFIRLLAPVGGFVDGPAGLAHFEDLSDRGPGGASFVFTEQENALRRLRGRRAQLAGPGEPGFRCLNTKNIIPHETPKKTEPATTRERTIEKGNPKSLR